MITDSSGRLDHFLSEGTFRHGTRDVATVVWAGGLRTTSGQLSVGGRDAEPLSIALPPGTYRAVVSEVDLAEKAKLPRRLCGLVIDLTDPKWKVTKLGRAKEEPVVAWSDAVGEFSAQELIVADARVWSKAVALEETDTVSKVDAKHTGTRFVLDKSCRARVFLGLGKAKKPVAVFVELNTLQKW
ncbi:MAG: hypothetical protein JNJ54_18400 [Myxococcaceae bacterium]|nr:hypothetical protein [Myxococcaceae bacterium]